MEMVDTGFLKTEPNQTDLKIQQESRAVARKTHDAAAVLFGLKIADIIRYKFKSISKLRKPGFTAPNIPAQNRI